jgi:hypothetical protein
MGQRTKTEKVANGKKPGWPGAGSWLPEMESFKKKKKFVCVSWNRGYCPKSWGM